MNEDKRMNDDDKKSDDSSSIDLEDIGLIVSQGLTIAGGY
jgi:hypothetical protein